jgi:hypothetical protein
VDRVLLDSTANLKERGMRESALLDKTSATAIDWAEIADTCETELSRYASGVGGSEAASEVRTNGFEVRIPDIGFPDGVGSGTIIARGYGAAGAYQVTITLDHNRFFRGGAGGPAGRLYPNDYIYGRKVGRGRPFTARDVRDAVRGIDRARSAIPRLREAMRKSGVSTWMVTLEAVAG